MRKVQNLAVSVMVLFSTSAGANDALSLQPSWENVPLLASFLKREPPPAAVAACDGKKEGVHCEFEGRRGNKVDGSCQTRSEKLVCIPTKRPDGEDE